MAEELSLTADSPPDKVAKRFVKTYYYKLLTGPDELQKFYNDASTMVRIDGSTKETATAELNIQQLINSLNYREMVIKSVNCLPSLNNGILLMVSGSVLKKGFSRWRMFVETFFLVPQEHAFSVHNDIFRYVDDEQQILQNPDPQRNLEDESISSVSSNTVEQENKGGDTESPKPISPKKAPSDPEGKLQQITPKEDIPDEELSNQLHQGTTVYKPYHSSAPIKPHEHDYAITLVGGVKKPGVDEASGSKDEEWAKKVYLSDIPMTLSASEIAKDLNQLGMVKSDGVVIKPPKDDSRNGYGFVEFEDASSTENAIQAHVVPIGPHRLNTSCMRRPRNVPVLGGRGTGGSFSKVPGDGRLFKGNNP